MKNRLAVLVSVAVLGGAAAGCGLINNSGEPAATAAATTPAATPATGRSTAGAKATSVKDDGDIPDPCTLLTKTEVTGLTGRAVTRIDEDGASPGDAARFCQWQQDGGQLAVFLSRTTAADFQVTVADAQDVDGVGEQAFTASGHLYVLYGTVQVDVYSRGADTDAQNLADAKKVAKVVIPRI